MENNNNYIGNKRKIDYNCFLCGSKDHLYMDCPKKNKNNLKNQYKYKICNKCKQKGHIEKNCLLYPQKIYIEDNNDIKLCDFCGSSEHFICPFNSASDDNIILTDYNSENVSVDSEGNVEKSNNKNSNLINNYRVNIDNFYSITNFFQNEILKKKSAIKNIKVTNKIFPDLDNKDIKHTIFCYKCGDMHKSSECKNNNNLNKNNIDEYKYLINLNKVNEDYYVKNPLKFGPMKKKNEFTINHHNIKKDYFNETDSSGKSYNEIFNKNK
jgi:hypothetical protein